MNFKLPSKCPHCDKEDAFIPIKFDDGQFAKATIDVQKFSDRSVGFTLAGPNINVVFKACQSCGFIAPFSIKNV